MNVRMQTDMLTFLRERARQAGESSVAQEIRRLVREAMEAEERQPA